MPRLLRWLPLYIGSFILALVGYAFFIEPNVLQVERVEISIDQLPPHLEGITIVQLSDLELDEHGLKYHHNQAIRRVNDLSADMVVITGDLIATGANYDRAVQQARHFVTQLEANYGVWVIRGENDFLSLIERSNLLPESLETDEITVLTNEVVEPMGAHSGLYLAGVDYTDFRPNSWADFAIQAQKSNAVYAAGASQKNAYTHYTGAGSATWQDYELSGRMQMKRPDGGLGLTFYSKLDSGVDKFYRIRRSGTEQAFHFVPHATTVWGEKMSTGVVPQPDIWYHFRVQVETGSEQTTMRAKVWPEQDDEPVDWQAEVYDRSASRLTTGTVGLWTNGSGQKYFDDLQVKPIDQSSAEQSFLSEDFEAYTQHQDPSFWLDFGNDAESVVETLRQVPDDGVRILLVHTSDLVQEAAQLDVDLVLTGGTHGGQIRLPFIGALYTGTKLGRTYSAGLYQVENTQLYINRGIGTSIIPARFLSPPEITVFELTPAP